MYIYIYIIYLNESPDDWYNTPPLPCPTIFSNVHSINSSLLIIIVTLKMFPSTTESEFEMFENVVFSKIYKLLTLGA
jgi:hypothetical protein